MKRSGCKSMKICQVMLERTQTEIIRSSGSICYWHSSENGYLPARMSTRGRNNTNRGRGGQAGRDTQRPNFFLSIRISDRTILDKLEDMQEEMKARLPQAPNKIFTKLHKSHLTLGVFSIYSETDYQTVLSALEDACHRQRINMPPAITVGGLGDFRTVVWAGIEQNDNRDHLLNGVHALRQHLETFQGMEKIVKREDFEPHITLIKSRGRSMDIKWLPQMQSENPEAFGEQPVEEVELLSMMDEAEDGYYKCVAKLKLPKRQGEQHTLEILSQCSAAPAVERRRVVKTESANMKSRKMKYVAKALDPVVVLNSTEFQLFWNACDDAKRQQIARADLLPVMKRLKERHKHKCTAKDCTCHKVPYYDPFVVYFEDIITCLKNSGFCEVCLPFTLSRDQFHPLPSELTESYPRRLRQLMGDVVRSKPEHLPKTWKLSEEEEHDKRVQARREMTAFIAAAIVENLERECTLSRGYDRSLRAMKSLMHTNSASTGKKMKKIVKKDIVLPLTVTKSTQIEDTSEKTSMSHDADGRWMVVGQAQSKEITAEEQPQKQSSLFYFEEFGKCQDPHHPTIYCYHTNCFSLPALLSPAWSLRI
ncbi:hypothetical protein PROFUN_03757 [Planoprotostelium fungivorum]|uniref:A-kinase anchor protein 7-like phosphoesterase domain-containing protein n=1 Tax=Planoprotostelium fungivorum TaxID=1890364 RepID=A0A2P6NDN5_9EUKA|nr:hypothetical protein PROFUN_03757 [Planoprotostelium fungivorum]